MSLHRFILLEQGLPCFAYPKALKIALALPRLITSDRNFNLFPFCHKVIGLWLRIALLLAEEHCQENRVLFGVQDSRLDMLLLIPRYSWLAGPHDLMAMLPPRQSAPLPNSTLRWNSMVSASGLSPVYLQNQQSRLVRYYALFKGWLLLSLPSSCFRLVTPSFHT